MYFTLESFIEYCKTPVRESISKYSDINRTWGVAYEADDASNTNNLEGSSSNNNNNDNNSTDNNNNSSDSDEDVQKRCEEKIQNVKEGGKTFWQSVKEFFANLFKTKWERRKDALVDACNTAAGALKKPWNWILNESKNENGEYDEDSVDRAIGIFGHGADKVLGFMKQLASKYGLKGNGTPKDGSTESDDNNNQEKTNNNANNNQNNNNNNQNNANTNNNSNNSNTNDKNKNAPTGDSIKDAEKASQTIKENKK